jgi:hypothetical protein
MNLRLNVIKFIVSIVLGIVIGVSFTIFLSDNLLGSGDLNEDLENASSPAEILVFIFVFVIIFYFLISLFEKGTEQPKSQPEIKKFKSEYIYGDYESLK